MKRTTITEDDIRAGYRGPFVTITQGIRGHFAVIFHFNTHDSPDGAGFWEPWDTHPSSFGNRELCAPAAIAWANAMGVPYLIGSHEQ